MAARNNKVSRIWGETKGNATDRDCILVLSRGNAEPYVNSEQIDWDEPYKDGGPDVVHSRVLERRIAS
jgi:site-specific DNA-methyltransferase (adenine-specific)